MGEGRDGGGYAGRLPAADAGPVAPDGRSTEGLCVGHCRGTNGKGTAANVLAALIQASGRRAGIYTSPHLHTIRERILIDGRILEKDGWARGIADLYDRTRGFEREGYGSFTRFEALTALAASMFARACVEIGVFEVGLGGRYDATNAWDSHVAVLTPVDLDHTEVLGRYGGGDCAG